MEKSEPSLVPEWLRSSGGGTGSGTLSHHFASLQSGIWLHSFIIIHSIQTAVFIAVMNYEYLFCLD